MSVVGTAKERIGKREKRITDTEHWYKRVYVVESDTHKDDPNVIERAFGLPKYGYHYVTEKSIDISARCYQMAVRPISHKLWDIEVEYTNKNDPTGKGDSSIDPMFEEPTWSWGGYQVRRVVTGQSTWVEYHSPETGQIYDSTGIVNSAFEPYNPPAEYDFFIPTLTFERNEPSFNHRYMLYYTNAVNKQRWYGWYSRTVKIASISGSFKTKQVLGRLVPYWRVQYTFHFNKETWDLFLLDIGSYYFEGGYDPTTQNIKRAFFAGTVPTLGLLTSDGDKSTTISRYNRYRILSELDFARLMIPIPK